MNIIAATTALFMLINMFISSKPDLKEAYYNEMSKIDFGYNIGITMSDKGDIPYFKEL